MTSVQPQHHDEVIMIAARCTLLGCLLLFALGANAELLDPDSAGHPFLERWSKALDDLGIDTAFNLNVRNVANTVPRRPRVGALADLPPLRFPMTSELLQWEQAFNAADIGAVAFMPAHRLPAAGAASSYQQFHDAWLGADAEERYFLTYHADDQESALAVVSALQQAHGLWHLPALSAASPVDVAESAGRLYATTGQRWIIDSVAARDYESEIAEFAYLGEELRRNSSSVVDSESRALRRIASGEPAVFLKESLGDEFEASTIPEIIVPGGIAFGENAVFANEFNKVVFENDRLWLEDNDGQRFRLPDEDVQAWKAHFDFAVRSEAISSDAIVDIDERGRVRISSTLQDTDVGVEMVRIDAEPPKYVQRLDVRKSVIIDTSVRFSVAGEMMETDAVNMAEFATEYEVRFLQSDRMRIATTQAAVVYQYTSATGQSQLSDSWGPDAFRLEGRTDFAGLGESTANAARHAAWIALFRAVVDNSLDFSHGRYDFMKIDKAGRSTPSRI
ncbi:MAG: hypothetical protein A3H44_11555 [Gammaproteobacteria bacterium RIFCSPLOWO2_02_FULL_57_10]|nr:MAG: hypothetical protein A3H44_11555 [Gammaproteobacteria bacterium RIFCSPLOWO2_02_FULL_57_10]